MISIPIQFNIDTSELAATRDLIDKAIQSCNEISRNSRVFNRKPIIVTVKPKVNCFISVAKVK